MSGKVLALSKKKAYTLEVMYDPEAEVYVGNCDELHVTAEGVTVDEVLHEAKSILPDMLELNHYPKDRYAPYFEVKEVRFFSEDLLEM